MELSEIIQKMKDAGLDPAQIPAATEIVADLVASGLDPQAVAEAYQAAIAPPPAPEIPEPKDSAPIFAYLLTPDGDNPEAPMLAVLAGIDAADWAATMTALMDFFRSAMKCKPEITALHEARRPKPQPEPIPVPVEELPQ